MGVGSVLGGSCREDAVLYGPPLRLRDSAVRDATEKEILRLDLKKAGYRYY
jgi:hypothetical protein